MRYNLKFAVGLFMVGPSVGERDHGEMVVDCMLFSEQIFSPMKEPFRPYLKRMLTFLNLPRKYLGTPLQES